jgi:hypothetical protein
MTTLEEKNEEDKTCTVMALLQNCVQHTPSSATLSVQRSMWRVSVVFRCTVHANAARSLEPLAKVRLCHESWIFSK